MADYQTIESANTDERGFTVVAKASGNPITTGTVNYYLLAKTGANAGKWWKDSDQTWAAAETANAMTHDADGHWTRALAASPWTDGVLFLEYAKESGDLHVPVSRRLKAGYTPSANSSRRVDLGLWLGSAPDVLSSGKVPADLKLWLASAPLALSAQQVQVIASAVTGAVGSVTGNVGGSVVGSVASVTDRTGFSLSAAGILAIWDQLLSATFGVGSIGEKIKLFFAALGSDNRPKVSADAHTGGVTAAAVTGAVGSVTGNVGGNVAGNVSGSVGSVAGSVGSVAGDVEGKVRGGGASTITGAGVRASSVDGAVGSVSGAVGSVAGNVGGDVAGKVLGGGASTLTGDGVRAASVTGEVTVGTNNDKTDYSLAANAITAVVLASDAGAELAAALLDLTAGVETGMTMRQALRIILAANAGKLSGAATTTIAIRDTNDSKDRITATVDGDGNRSSVVLDAS